jgi:uncharacterized protein (DUF2236 family)
MTGDPGLFGPESVTWRVNRERVMLLGGGCALLLQLAHPLVAAGVADHSSFKADPLQRLNRTLNATLAMIFGTHAEAERAAAQIRAVHGRVRGTLAEKTGAFEAGTSYDAADPELLLWVQATLVDTSMRAFELFVGPFVGDERARYYDETKVTARLLGIPDEVLPATYEAFARYYDETLRDADIAVGRVGHDLADHVLRPRLPLVPRPALAWASAFTIGLLPTTARHKYGYRWTAARERSFRRRVGIVGATARALPLRLRLFPQAYSALHRVGAV